MAHEQGERPERLAITTRPDPGIDRAGHKRADDRRGHDTRDWMPAASCPAAVQELSRKSLILRYQAS